MSNVDRAPGNELTTGQTASAGRQAAQESGRQQPGQHRHITAPGRPVPQPPGDADVVPGEVVGEGDGPAAARDGAADDNADPAGSAGGSVTGAAPAGGGITGPGPAEDGAIGAGPASEHGTAAWPPRDGAAGAGPGGDDLLDEDGSSDDLLDEDVFDDQVLIEDEDDDAAGAGAGDNAADDTLGTAATGMVGADAAETGPTETGPTETGPAETGPAETGPAETSPAETSPAETGAAGGIDDGGFGGDPPPHAHLLEGEELRNMVTRWKEIQAQFVDEPETAVADADALVAELMQRLVRSLADERALLESRWAGGDVSTEDLRQGLRRYRSFFERLLAA